MRPKVLLIEPAEGFSGEGTRGKPESPNLGLSYLRGVLKKECDVDVTIVEMFPSGLSVKDISAIILNYQPNIVGITAKTFNILIAYTVARSAKQTQPGTITVLGGAHGTAVPELTLGECQEFDAIVRGEGEYTMKEIVDRFSQGVRGSELFSDIPGITYRAPSDEIIHNVHREPIADLDDLPFPDYSIYDLEAYKKAYNLSTNRNDRRFSVTTSRGCPYQRTFCMPQSHKVRCRSVSNVIAEIELLVSRYNARHLYFEDSIFGLYRDWLEEFCQEFTQAGLHQKVAWGFESRIELIQDKDIVKNVKEAGCVYLNFEIESGNENVLRHAKKNFSKD
ncbi:B12-binding domain-containing radical SAM protein [Chloroflexota bacterium]